jgi:hypothetical protein
MKNVFAVKHQKTPGVSLPDGQGFITKKVTEEQLALIDTFDDKVRAINNKTKLPIWLLIIYYIMIFISIASILGIVGGIEDVSLAVAFQRGPLFFILLPISLAIWIALALYKRYMTKKVTNSQELKDLQAEAVHIINDSKAQLGIPLDAIKIDTLHYFYDEKNGNVKPKTYGSAQYFNMEMHAFSDQEAFYLGDLTRLFRFPLSDLKSIIQIDKPIGMDNWNKPESINSPHYSEYKIKANSTGALFFKPYFVLILKDQDNEDFSIIFPAYEKEALEKVTGLKITTGLPLTKEENDL